MIDPMRMRSEGVNQSAPGGIPNPYRFVAACCINLVRSTPFYAPDDALVTRQNMFRDTGIDYPDTDGRIFARARQARRTVPPQVIWLPSKARYKLCMSPEGCCRRIAGLRIPKSNRMILAARRKSFAIR